MKFAIAAFLASAASATNYANQQKYMQYLADQGKSYITVEEFNARFELFQATEEMINQHNSSQDDYVLGHNIFSDMTKDEKSKWFGAIPEDWAVEDEDDEYTSFDDEYSIPSSIDWRSKGAVQPIQQQQCGDCWAFATVAVMESAHFNATGKLLKLSEQQLIDCSYNETYNEYGCAGGNLGRAFEYFSDYYVLKNSDYPYAGGYDQSCKYDKVNHTNIKAKTIVKPDKKKSLNPSIAIQVVGATVEATDSFQAYESGIYNDTKCGDDNNHVIDLVGYGNHNGQDYYIIRNSWGTWWGEKGYMRMAQHGDGAGICGIQKYPVYATSN